MFVCIEIKESSLLSVATCCYTMLPVVKFNCSPILIITIITVPCYKMLKQILVNNHFTLLVKLWTELS